MITVIQYRWMVIFHVWMILQTMLALSAHGWLSWRRLQQVSIPKMEGVRRSLGTTAQQWVASVLPSPPPPTATSILQGDEESEKHTNIETMITPYLSLSQRRRSIHKKNDLVIADVGRDYGMPWQTSIDMDYNLYHQDGLFYMPFWEWQLNFMQTHLHNLRLIPTISRRRQYQQQQEDDDHEPKDLTYVEHSQKKKRMITICFESDEYRLIRMTYLDAGMATQVFTSLFYPRVNLPVLGVDLLQFHNQSKHLTVVDMQPIHPNEDDHDMTYTHVLESIRNRYPSLQHRMSKKFYDENQFFSSQMLLGRGENGPEYVWKELFPAYKSYVQTHLSLVKTILEDDDDDDEEGEMRRETSTSLFSRRRRKRRTDYTEVLRRHKAYDDYSSVRDPAHGLLKSLFGRDYADAFVYDVLFPLSDPPQLSNEKGK